MSSKATQQKRKASLSAATMNEIERERNRVESMVFAEARDALQEELFGIEEGRFHYGTVFALFQAFPGLAKELFSVPGDEDEEESRQVLSFLHSVLRLRGPDQEANEREGGLEPLFALARNLDLDAGEHLELVKMVHELNPEALKTSPTVLYFGCRYHAPEEVVLFLIEKYPEAAGRKSRVMMVRDGGKNVLHHVLEWDKPSQKVIEALVKASPGLGQHYRSFVVGTRTPFELALEKKMDSAILSMLLPNHPSITSCDLASIWVGASDIEPAISAVLASSISAFITDLVLSPQGFTAEGFKTFLVVLSSNESLSKVTLC